MKMLCACLVVFLAALAAGCYGKDLSAATPTRPAPISIHEQIVQQDRALIAACVETGGFPVTVPAWLGNRAWLRLEKCVPPLEIYTDRPFGLVNR